MVTRRALLHGLAAAAALSGCRRRPSTAPDVQALPRVSRPAPGVGRYESRPWSFSTASYWIDAPDGVVVFDTQFLRSEAEAVIEAAEATTGKRVVAAIVHHANPDKFNGTATFQEHGARVITSSQVLASIPAVHAQRLQAFGQRYAPDFPLERPTPRAFGDHTCTLSLAGTSITLHVMGPGCGAHHLVSQWGGHLFVGDLVANGTHSWMELGLLDAWQQRLAELTALAPTAVHPGRGPSGGAPLLSAQAEYLHEVRALADAAVASASDHDEGTAAQRRLRVALMARFPQHRFEAFLDVALPTLWRDALRRQAASASRTGVSSVEAYERKGRESGASHR